MAANIILSGLSLAADGKTLTGTISGGTGTGYAPASGVTGLTVKAAGNVCPIASSSISGTTLTLVLVGSVGSSQTATVDIAITSNLTDSGANTAQGQTNIAVTNGSSRSVATFSLATATTAGLFVSGQTSTTTSASRTAVTPSTTGQFDFKITVPEGADVLLGSLFAGTGIGFSVSLNGGAFVDTTTIPSANTWYSQVLASNLAAGTHTLTMRVKSGVTMRFDTSNLLLVTYSSTAPTISAPDATLFGTQYPVYTNQTKIALEGGASYALAFGGNDVVDLGVGSSRGFPDKRIRFKATCSTIRIWARTVSQKWRLVVDGVNVGNLITATGTAGEWYWHTIATGLDSSAEHTYEIVMPNGTTNSGLVIYSVMTIGGSGIVNTTSARSRKVAFYGDSISAGDFSTGTSNDSTLAWVHRVGLSAGANVYNLGISSTQVTGTGTAGQARTSDVTNLAPDVCEVLYGINDIRNGVAMATLQTNYQAMVSSLLNGSPSTKFIFRTLSYEAGRGLGSTSRNPTIDTFNSWLVSYIGGLGNANAIVRQSGALIATDATSLPDGVHPSTSGYLPYINESLPFAASTGYSLSPSAVSGAVGSPVTLTLTRAGGSNWVTGETVTLNDGSGGTFGPLNHAGGNSATMTYTPASAGAKTITPTNGQGWTNPASVAFNALANAKFAQRTFQAGLRSFSGGLIS